jgi:hypothetical protein
MQLDSVEIFLLFVVAPICSIGLGALWGEIYGTGWRKGAVIGIVTAYVVLLILLIKGDIKIF